MTTNHSFSRAAKAILAIVILAVLTGCISDPTPTPRPATNLKVDCTRSGGAFSSDKKTESCAWEGVPTDQMVVVCKLSGGTIYSISEQDQNPRGKGLKVVGTGCMVNK